MKKKILAIVLALILTVSTMSACSLISKDQEKVAAKPVITIGEGVKAQEITINDLVNSFNSNGMQYIMYGLDVKTVMDMVVNSVIQDACMTLSALDNLPVIDQAKAENKETLYEAYLSADEIAKVNGIVEKAISSYIDSIETGNLLGDKKAPTYIATPAGFVYECPTPIDFVGTDSRKDAVKGFEDLLVKAELTRDEYVASVTTNYMKNEMLNKYRNSLTDGITATEADAKAKYDEIVKLETEKYAEDIKNFKTKLDAVASAGKFTGTNFVINIPEGQTGYGYAMNLLLGFSDEQSAKVAEWKQEVKDEKMTQEEFEAKYIELSKEIVVSDVRVDWLKQYGDSTNLFDEIPLDGTAVAEKVDGVQIKDENGEFKYSTLNLNEYTVDEFMAMLDEVLGGTAVEDVDGISMKQGTATKEAFETLIAKYSTDPGSRANEMGYLATPDPDDSGMVESYAKASTAVVKSGVGSYTTCVSEFGIHVIFTTTSYDTEGVVNEFNSADLKTEGTFTNSLFVDVETAMKNAKFSETIKANQKVYEEDMTKDDKAIANLVSDINKQLGK